MRVIEYSAVIRESEAELLSIERDQKLAQKRDRVRFIRYLKTGLVSSQAAAGEQIGLKRRRSQQLWQLYQQEGLTGLLASQYKGSWSKLSSQQQTWLLQGLDQDDIARQGQARQWVEDAFGIPYSQAGFSQLLARLKVKLKTGRPVNVRKDEAGEAAFKKTIANW